MTYDQDLRAEALRLANIVGDQTPSETIRRAEKYYEFLKGPEGDD